MLIDAYLAYQFIKKLVTPFNKMEAYRRGLIDEDGNFLRKRSEFNSDDRKALGLFDVAVINLKKILAKLPAGQTRLGTIAAAMYLLRSEPKRLKEDLDTEDMTIIEEDFNQILAELESLELDEDGAPTNVTAGVAGMSADDLKVPPASRRKYVRNNASDTLNLIRRMNMMKRQQLQK